MLQRLALILLGMMCLAGIGTVRAADLLRVDGRVVKWAPPESGTTTVITYTTLSGPHVVGRGTRTLSPDNCGVMQSFARIASSSPDIDQSDMHAELRSAFAAWEQVADVVFVEVSEPRFAQIVVGATETPAGRAFANIGLRGGADVLQPADRALGATADTVAPGVSAGSDVDAMAVIEQAFICLNPKMRWKIGFDGNLSIYDLRLAFTHEIGHAIGLDHPERSRSVMRFRYDESVREPQPSDIAAVQRLYGPPANR